MPEPLDLEAVLARYVACPSVSADSAFADGMAAARDCVVDILSGLGLETEVVATPRHPVILARRSGPAEWPHVVVYGHYDVQPPDPLELWTTPPFRATRQGNRVYGRGTADNKGPLLAHVDAVARLLHESPDLPLRVTFLIEGEEEIGSPSLPQVLADRREALSGDFVLLSDTLSPGIDQVAITTGLRGVVCLEARVTGPDRDLHSGIHGGAVMNPIRALAAACGTLHDDQGRVNIPGFYDDVVPSTDWDREQVQGLGLSEADYARSLGVPALLHPDGLSPMEATRFLPTLEYNGIGGGYQGEGSKTIIPSRAFVKISCRLVPHQDPRRVQNLVQQALRDRLPESVTLEVSEDHVGPPYSVTPPFHPNPDPALNPRLAAAFETARKAAAAVFPKPPLFLREGGSVPIIADIKRITGMDSLMFGLFTPADNLHSPDESVDLTLLERGSRLSEAILRSVAGA